MVEINRYLPGAFWQRQLFHLLSTQSGLITTTQTSTGCPTERLLPIINPVSLSNTAPPLPRPLPRQGRGLAQRLEIQLAGEGSPAATFFQGLRIDLHMQ